MKIFLSVFFLLLIPFPVFAGFYYDNDFRYIEPTKNFLYISVGEAKNNKICILTHHPKKHLYSLWFCDKSGQNLKQVKTIFANTVWWFDVKNDKICFVRQIKDRIQYESIEW